MKTLFTCQIRKLAKGKPSTKLVHLPTFSETCVAKTLLRISEAGDTLGIFIRWSRRIFGMKTYIELISILPSGEFVKSFRDLDVSKEVPPWRLCFPDGVFRGWKSMLLKTL